MPAYHAEKTLERTFREIPFDVVDQVILVDDASKDRTVELAHDLGIHTVIQHERNVGYGGNQKTCYQQALKSGADIIIMLHPDYQYTPTLIEPLAWMIAHNTYDVALGTRMSGNTTLSGGMPLYKYMSNRTLTFLDNVIMGQHLSEFHTGYRAYSRFVLGSIPFLNNSDDFVFDNQILAQIIYAGFRIGEISCPTRYFPEASTINFKNSVRYGFGVLKVASQYRLQAWHVANFKIFEGIQQGKRGLKYPPDDSSSKNTPFPSGRSETAWSKSDVSP